jgi:hypothetical protein
MYSSKRQGYERPNSQIESVMAKDVPHAGLLMLKADGSNQVAWTTALDNHIEATFGTYGTSFTRGVLLVRPQPDIDRIRAEFAGLTAANIQKLLVEEVSQFKKDTRKDGEHKNSIYALIRQVTSEDGMSRVENLAGYAAVALARDPVALVALVKSEHSLRTNNMSEREAKHVAEKRYWRLRQGPKQPDSEFADEFKMCVANMVTLGCTSTPTPAEQAMNFLTCLQPKVHAEFMRDAINRERSTPGAIPNTVAAVMDAARMFIPTPSRSTSSADGRQTMVYAGLTAAQKKKPCANCGELGHWARDCTLPDSRKAEGKKDKETAVAKKNAGKQVFQACAENDDDELSSDDGDESVDILGHGFVSQVYTSRVPKSRRADKFTIDSFADESFVMCEKHLDGGVDESTSVKGIHGVETLKRRGTLPGIGPCIVSPSGGVNGISLSQLEERYRVEYEQNVCFRVFVDDQLTLVFEKTAGSCAYSCVITSAVFDKLREGKPRFNYTMVATVAEREAQHTKREVARAQEARKMRRRLFYPSDGALVRTLHKGVMTNCDVTGRDVSVSVNIYGKDIPSIKGKTKDKGAVEDRIMYVPVMDRKEQRAYMDVFHWRGESFILFIVKPLRLLMLEHLTKAKMPQMCAAVETLCKRTESRGFQISEIVVDPAKELASMVGKVSRNITVVGSRTHVADAEVEIRTVKERMRCTEAGLPYKVCKRVIKWLAYGVVQAYNVVLRAGQEVSARELFTGIKTDYRRDFRAEFGEYVQAHVVPSGIEKSGNTHRAVGAVALCPTGNYKGTHWFLSLRTGRVLMADRWDALPMPDLVIEVMNQLHDRDDRRGKSLSHDTRGEEAEEQQSQQGMQQGEEVVVPTARDVVEAIDEAPLGVPDSDTTDMPEAISQVQDMADDMDHTDSGEEGPMFSSSDHTELEEENTGVQHDNSSVQRDSSSVQHDSNSMQDSNNTQHNSRRSARIATGDHFAEHAVHIFRVSIRKKYDRVTAGRVVNILRLTVKKALAKDHDATVASIIKEFRQLLDKGVWTVLRKGGLTYAQLKNSIRSSMFLKEKYDAAGVFEKLKARLVAGGNEQDKTLYDQLSCPTVTQEAIMMVLNIAARERRKVRTIDITGAYLECDMTGEVEVIMKLDPLLTRILHEVDKSVKGTEDEKGVTYVKLNKALYGTIQAAVLWYNKLKGVLMADGFAPNPYDACLFNKVVNGVQITVAFHVDDLLVTCVCEKLMDSLEAHLNGNFANITVCSGSRHSYLAMNIVLGDSGIEVDMTAYIAKCTKGKIFRRAATSPARDDLFEEPEDSEKLSVEDKVEFHSEVAKLLYVTKRTRVESLCAVSHLSSRVNSPALDDQKKLDRVMNYLDHTKERKVTMKWGGSVTMEAYIDASFGGHVDCRSRSGIMLMMSGSCVGAWSAKQKLNTKSSTEAEIVGLSDGLSHVIWARELLSAQGYVLPPTEVHQDNQGVLSIMSGGRSPKHRTKHLDIRHFFVRDRVATGDVVLRYCPTREMVADMLTKAVNGELFQYLVSMLQ